jgi:hypothetical protein
MSDSLRRFAAALVLLVVPFAAAAALAQGVTAQVSGVVVDATDSAVPGVTVTITNADTNWHRELVTEVGGRFVFVDVLSGTYVVSAAREGFSTVERKDVAVGSTDRVELPALVLNAGGVYDTITVTGEADLVQTTTGARSARITRSNLDDIARRGRDALGLLKLMPGVIDTNTREAPSWNLLTGLSINGRSTGINLAYDGVTNRASEAVGGNFAAPSVDSIGEVRVQSANFQAEYGRSSGASINVITRSGSKDFRGSAAFYKRDAALNGNEYQRKQQCAQGDRLSCEAALYRFDNFAWTLGGPILVPSTAFNRQRNRLFFFWSQELLARTDPGTLNLRRMPTARERLGDFSETVDSAGKRIFIRDPKGQGPCSLTGGGEGCFAENIIPPGRLDPTGQALLNLFPLPNATDPSGANQYNYAYQMVQDVPRNDQVLRVDWNVGPRTTVYGRLQFGYEKRAGPVAMFGFTGGWPRMASKFESDSVSYVTTLLHTINQTTFVEATTGVNWFHQYASPFDQSALDANNRAMVLPGMPQFFPEANPLDLLPNATFGGGIQSGGPASLGLFTYERRFPFDGYTTVWDFSSSITKALKAHQVKAGIFVEHATRPAQQRSFYNGTFSFNADTAHPLNTNIGFANALLGAVTSFQQSDRRPIGHGQFVNTEFYVQDNWRVSRSFTVDAGLRFYYLTPTRSRGDEVAQFEPERFDPAAAPLLYRPATIAGARRAINPVTGDVLPSLYIGRPIPGTGDVYNGTQVYEGTPQRRSPFEVAPRLGFAWRVTADGRTAIRGGAGAFYDRYGDNDILELTELPPLVNTYTANYTTIAELLSTTPTPTTNAMRRIQEFVPPVVYNWSAGVQRDLGWNLVADFAYVGNAARRQAITRELNGRPYGYRFLPSSLDTTNVNNRVTQPLHDDLLRPYAGYASISQREFTGYADYHSLQLSAARRQRADGLTFGVAYTYEIVNKTLGAIDPFLASNRARNYNSAGGRPHSLNIHYSWLVPGLSRSRSVVLRGIVNDWQLSGVTSFLSGTQGGFTYSYREVPQGVLTDNGSIGGGPNRPRIICDPSLPRSQRTSERQFRTECIAAPDDAYHFGTASDDEFQGPGYVNWDMSVFKHIPMGGSRRLQLRAELYNAFNTYQWTTVNTNAEFNFATGALANPNVFGRLTGATNSARRIQLAARFTF